LYKDHQFANFASTSMANRLDNQIIWMFFRNVTITNVKKINLEQLTDASTGLVNVHYN